MAINKISNATKELIREQSVLSLPDRPTEKGFTAQQLKEYFTNLVLGDQGALTEIDRIVNEINEMVGDIGDETIKNYVTNSIISKLIEQSPYIGLSIVNNKLRYTRFGSPNITGELDYIPSDSVFFNGENLVGKNKNVILPKTSIDKLVDRIDDKTVREYVLGLNSKINELLEKHNKEIESINSSIEAILGGDAPDALNSIKELAEALKNNPSQVDNILLQLSNLENNKVDRIDGKQLSTNDYDNESKAFVDSLKTKKLIEEEDLKTDLSQFNDDSEHRLVSDEEKNKWNAKADGNHKHEIEDVNGLNDALNDKSHKDHTHTADEIDAEKKGVAKELIQSHNSNEKSHEDIRLILDLLRNRVDGIHSAISFYDEQQLIDWLNGVYTRNDEVTPDKLFIGQHIYIKNQEENDYWVAATPVTSLSELLPLQTDKINLEDYAEIENLKRVAFTGNYKDLNDVPNIPNALSQLSEDDEHRTITKQKLELIDKNASQLLEKIDKNLGLDEANKMLITDSTGNIVTAEAGSMAILIDNLESTSTSLAPTANQVRVLNNIKLDKQQGTENANKYLYVNGLGLVDLATIKTKLSEFINDNNYQTLTEVQALIDAIPTPDVSGQISSHNIDDEAHQDIRDLIPSLSGYATENFVKTEISKIPTPDVSGQISIHNTDSSSHKDIRDLIDTKIAALINGAPTTLDTLKEIADAMSSNQSVVSALETSIGKKANTSDLENYVTKTGYSMRASSTVGMFYYNTGAGEKAIQVKMPTIPVTSVNGQTGEVVIDIPDTSGFVPNTRTVNGKSLSSNISLGNKDVGALPDYTLTINHGTAGNPRMVKFASVNYSSAATCFKMGAMTCHDNGVSYQFLTDMLIAVTKAGDVTANIYKFAQSSVDNVDGVARYTGDVFYVNNTTNKIVDFYILCGQYSSSQFTPVTKVGSTTIANVTQYSGTATYYSSGTKVWANGCGSTYARTSDIPDTSNLATTNTNQTISGIKTHTNGLVVSGRSAGGGDDEGINVAWASNGYAGVCLGSPSARRSVFYLKDGASGTSAPLWRYAGSGFSYDLYHPGKAGTIATTSDLGTQATFSLSGTTLTITPK